MSRFRSDRRDPPPPPAPRDPRRLKNPEHVTEYDLLRASYPGKVRLARFVGLSLSKYGSEWQLARAVNAHRTATLPEDQ